MDRGGRAELAFLDTNVLFGALHADLYLTFVEEEVIAGVWSEYVMDELRRALAARHGVNGIEGRLQQMAAVFKDQLISSKPDSRFSGLLPDIDDEQVLADAVQSGCSLIVTLNLRDFPNDVVADYGIRVLTPDAHLTETMLEATEEFIEVVEAWLTRRHRPAYTKVELVARLREVGLPDFAGALERAWGGLIRRASANRL